MLPFISSHVAGSLLPFRSRFSSHVQSCSHIIIMEIFMLAIRKICICAYIVVDFLNCTPPPPCCVILLLLSSETRSITFLYDTNAIQLAYGRFLSQLPYDHFKLSKYVVVQIVPYMSSFRHSIYIVVRTLSTPNASLFLQVMLLIDMQ